ncbi:rod shape-determining protein RodA [Orrella daihaiensis]|uniref:Peptidoglycan glycosyltransferase MrdB n=1 Tax=Orrella daihaiensis TaxID=2782176 RepID=A0ABY4AIV9_9BURK|nr:rod shape-determining protein RodA [Orrella daihaiensis]UOD50217.1 rod shape-determining protein RodA [Orrella daihaiensis]
MISLFNWLMQGLRAIDWPLLLIVACLSGIGLLVMHSAVGGTDWRFEDQSQYFVFALVLMWTVALVPPQWLAKMAPLLYGAGLFLLVAVMFVGDTSKGATRWLDLGFVRLQPSEIMKIALPLLLAWYFQKREGKRNPLDYLIGLVLVAVPFLLIVRQPDLGTALLVASAGFFVLYFAGLSFKLLVPVTIAAVLGIGLVLAYEDSLCAPQTDWVVLHEYQKGRVCTLLDPAKDPLGKGFHTIQSTIAVGSGGLYGRGYMEGTQAQLDFIPERTTDFIFAVFAEEFGLYGSVALLFLFLLMVARGLVIAQRSETTFCRLAASSLTMVLFVYVFVNIGMVIGILPVVGVPLPFFSYGGTALLTLALALGILMSVSAHRSSMPASNARTGLGSP